MPITSEEEREQVAGPGKGFRRIYENLHRLAACSRGKILQARAEGSAKKR